MKKNKLLIIVTIALVGVVNLLQPFQNAKACDPWDPNWNFLTGECDEPDPYSGEVAEESDFCTVWVAGFEYHTGSANRCVWSMVGECTPKSCSQVNQEWLNSL